MAGQAPYPARVDPSPAPAGPWFNDVAAFLGPAYWAPGTGRVMAFTRGTDQEVDFLIDALGLRAGQRVLDVGCGPGRHALALAERGIDVTGVDASPDFVALARAAADARALPASFAVLDVRDLAYDGEFDAAICLCQGGFGLLGGRDEVDVFTRITRSVDTSMMAPIFCRIAIRSMISGSTAALLSSPHACSLGSRPAARPAASTHSASRSVKRPSSQ